MWPTNHSSNFSSGLVGYPHVTPLAPTEQTRVADLDELLEANTPCQLQRGKIVAQRSAVKLTDAAAAKFFENSEADLRRQSLSSKHLDGCNLFRPGLVPPKAT